MSGMGRKRTFDPSAGRCQFPRLVGQIRSYSSRAGMRETARVVQGWTAMDMPDFKPVQPPTGQAKLLVITCVAIFIIVAFAFAYWINLPDWH